MHLPTINICHDYRYIYKYRPLFIIYKFAARNYEKVYKKSLRTEGIEPSASPDCESVETRGRDSCYHYTMCAAANWHICLVYNVFFQKCCQMQICAFVVRTAVQ